MIGLGYAYEYTYEKPYKYQAVFKNVQEFAQSNKLGLWAGNSCNGQRILPSPTQKSQINTNSQNENQNQQKSSQCKYSCISPDRDCNDFGTHDESVQFFNCC